VNAVVRVGSPSGVLSSPAGVSWRNEKGKRRVGKRDIRVVMTRKAAFLAQHLLSVMELVGISVWCGAGVCRWRFGVWAG